MPARNAHHDDACGAGRVARSASMAGVTFRHNPLLWLAEQIPGGLFGSTRIEPGTGGGAAQASSRVPAAGWQPLRVRQRTDSAGNSRELQIAAA